MVLAFDIRKLDLLGHPINLHFKNRSEVKSLLGAAVSMILLTLLCFVIIIEINYENFISKYSHVWYFKKYSENNKISLDGDSLPLAIFLEDGEGNMLSHSDYFYIKGLKITNIRKNFTNSNLNENISLDKCKKEKFQKLFSKEKFENYNFSRMLCITNQSIYLQENENLKFELKLNKNIPSSFSNEFNKIFSDKIKLKILFLKSFVNESIVQLKNNQEKVHLLEFSINIKKETTRTLEISLRQDVYNFYDMYSTSIKSTKIIFKPEMIDRDERYTQDDILAEIYIFPSHETKIINVLQRNYFHLFSNIVGLGLFLYISFKLIYSKIASFINDLEMINSIFIFENPEYDQLSQIKSKLPLLTSQKVKLFDLGSENRQSQSKNLKINLRYMNSELEMKNIPSDEVFDRVRKNSDLKMSKLEKYEKTKMEDFCSTPTPKKLSNGRFSINNFLKGKLYSQEYENPNKDQMTKIISEILSENLKNKSFKFSFLEGIYAKLCSSFKNNKCTKNNSLYLKAEKELKKYLDVSFYIKKFNEIHILKLLFLNSQEHVTIFDHINKDIVFKFQNAENFSQSKEFYYKNDNLPSILADLKDRVENRSIKSDLDRKLYDLLPEEMKRPF